MKECRNINVGTKRKQKKRRRRDGSNTLICILQALTGLRLVVELRNEVSVKGKLDTVDTNMNLKLSSVLYKAVQSRTVSYDKMMILGRNIRFVHIPDSIDISKLLEAREKRSNKARSLYERPIKQDPSELPSDST